MFEQLTQLVQQFGNEHVVNNPAIPNEHNEAVMQETGSGIMTALQGLAANGGIEQLAGLFSGNNAQSGTNPIVKMISDQVAGNIGAKLGISPAIASSVASAMIPQIMGSLVSKAKDPNDNSIQLNDIAGAIGGSNNGDLMSAIASAAGGNGGIGGMLGKLFG